MEQLDSFERHERYDELEKTRMQMRRRVGVCVQLVCGGVLIASVYQAGMAAAGRVAPWMTLILSIAVAAMMCVLIYATVREYYLVIKMGKLFPIEDNFELYSSFLNIETASIRALRQLIYRVVFLALITFCTFVCWTYFPGSFNPSIVIGIFWVASEAFWFWQRTRATKLLFRRVSRDVDQLGWQDAEY